LAWNEMPALLIGARALVTSGNCPVGPIKQAASAAELHGE